MSIEIQGNQNQIHLSDIPQAIIDWLVLVNAHYLNPQNEVDFGELLLFRENNPDIAFDNNEVQAIITNTWRTINDGPIQDSAFNNILVAAIQSNNTPAFNFFWDLLSDEYKISMLSNAYHFDVITNRDIDQDGAVGSLLIISLLTNNDELSDYIVSEAMRFNLLEQQVTMCVYANRQEVDQLTWLYQISHDIDKDEHTREKYKMVSQKIIDYCNDFDQEMPIHHFIHSDRYPEVFSLDEECIHCIQDPCIGCIEGTHH